MKKVIIAIHGLGNKPPKYLLKKWWKDAILEGFKSNEINKKIPEFEMVYWADILYKKPLDYWEKDPKSKFFLDEPYKKAPKEYIADKHSYRKKIVDFLTLQMNKIFLNDDKSLKYSFLSEFIMKSYFKDLEVYYKDDCIDDFDETCKVRNRIRNRLVDTIKRYQGYEIMILSHSMGSIIAFDVLKFLIPETEINTFVTFGSPLGIPIVVSKIAAEQRRKLNGANIMDTPPGVINNWYNLSDIMDNVAINSMLADDFVKNKKGIGPKDFLVVNNYEFKGHKNPHKSFGYLRTPEFSGIIAEFLGVQKTNMAQKVKDGVQKVFEKIKVQGNIVKDKLKIDSDEQE